MAFKKTLAQRLLNLTKISANHRISPSSSSLRSRIPSKPDIAPDPGDAGIFRRFLHKRSVFPPELRPPPAADHLLQRLREMDIARTRIRFDGLAPPQNEGGVTVQDVKKVLRAAQIENVKSKLRRIPQSCITYSELVRLCSENCSDEDQAMNVAKILDDSASVIIIGDIVFLRPEQVAKSIEALFPTAGAKERESVRKEVEEMEKEKRRIEKRAETLVRRELWAGLGFVMAQTAAFMRLTFWELSWDVMEPICFYVTSMYFMAGYTFFLRTSKEPCFEGFYQSRFTTHEKRLMKLHNFDIARYNQLRASSAPPPPSTSTDFHNSSHILHQSHHKL